MRPEHTVAAYQLAVDQGADVIECDLAVTKVIDLYLKLRVHVFACGNVDW